MFKTKLLKKIDSLVGAAIASWLPPAVVCPLQTPRHFLLIRPGGVGDAVLLAQLIITIKKSCVSNRISILAERRNSGVFKLIPQVDNVVHYDRPTELIQVLLDNYDVVIDTEQWYRLSAVVARMVRAPVKIGFGTNDRSRLFSHAIQYDENAFEGDAFLDLLKPLGLDCHRDPVTLELPLESLSRAKQLLQPLCTEPFVVIFPGSSIREKRWGVERFSCVAKCLDNDGYKVVVVGGHEDRVDGERIVGDAGLCLAGMTTISETAAVIACSKLVISGDSGVLHIAAGLNIPTVSLFGPSSVMKWAPRGKKHVVLNYPQPCSSCSKYGTIPSCPIEVRCMKEITPDEVVEAARRLLLQPPELKQ